jgi:hypothetical protein
MTKLLRRLWCFLFWHQPADIGCVRIATGKRVHQCMRCGELKDVE